METLWNKIEHRFEEGNTIPIACNFPPENEEVIFFDGWENKIRKAKLYYSQFVDSTWGRERWIIDEGTTSEVKRIVSLKDKWIQIKKK